MYVRSQTYIKCNLAPTIGVIYVRVRTVHRQRHSYSLSRSSADDTRAQQSKRTCTKCFICVALLFPHRSNGRRFRAVFGVSKNGLVEGEPLPCAQRPSSGTSAHCSSVAILTRPALHTRHPHLTTHQSFPLVVQAACLVIHEVHQLPRFCRDPFLPLPHPCPSPGVHDSRRQQR